MTLITTYKCRDGNFMLVSDPLPTDNSGTGITTYKCNESMQFVRTVNRDIPQVEPNTMDGHILLHKRLRKTLIEKYPRSFQLVRQESSPLKF